MDVLNASQGNHKSEASSGKHRTVYVVHGDQEAHVDEQIAPLVKAMWLAGIQTFQSCQDNPAGWVWLQFDSSFHLERFLSAIGDYDSDVGSLHDRMLHGYDRIVGPRVGQWRYEITVHDWAVDEADTDTGDVEIIYEGAPDFVVSISPHFPCTDLPEVFERISRFNCNSQ